MGAERGRALSGLLQTRARTPSKRYRGASLIRKHHPLGPYRRPVPRVWGGGLRGERFLMSEVPLYLCFSLLLLLLLLLLRLLAVLPLSD